MIFKGNQIYSVRYGGLTFGCAFGVCLTGPPSVSLQASKNVTLQVPVGVAIHTPLVCFVTLFVTVLCSMLILVTVFKHGHFSL